MINSTYVTHLPRRIIIKPKSVIRLFLGLNSVNLEQQGVL